MCGISMKNCSYFLFLNFVKCMWGRSVTWNKSADYCSETGQRPRVTELMVSIRQLLAVGSIILLLFWDEKYTVAEVCTIASFTVMFCFLCSIRLGHVTNTQQANTHWSFYSAEYNFKLNHEIFPISKSDYF